MVDGKTIQPTSEHVEKIVNAEPPKTKRGVKSLCGAIGFVRKFIPNCAAIVKPFTELLAKDHPDRVEWGSKQREGFEKVKEILTSEPIVVRYDVNKPHEIMSNANDDAVGGVLFFN